MYKRQAINEPQTQANTTLAKSRAAIGITPSEIMKQPIGTAAFNVSFSARVNLFLASRQAIAMPNGCIIEAMICTVLASLIPSAYKAVSYTHLLAVRLAIFSASSIEAC